MPHKRTISVNVPYLLELCRENHMTATEFSRSIGEHPDWLNLAKHVGTATPESLYRVSRIYGADTDRLCIPIRWITDGVSLINVPYFKSMVKSQGDFKAFSMRLGMRDTWAYGVISTGTMANRLIDKFCEASGAEKEQLLQPIDAKGNQVVCGNKNDPKAYELNIFAEEGETNILIRIERKLDALLKALTKEGLVKEGK